MRDSESHAQYVHFILFRGERNPVRLHPSCTWCRGRAVLERAAALLSTWDFICTLASETLFILVEGIVCFPALFGIIINWVTCLCLLKPVVLCFLHKVPAATLNSTAVLMSRIVTAKIPKTATDVLWKAVQVKLLHLLGMSAKISILISSQDKERSLDPPNKTSSYCVQNLTKLC